MKKLLLLFICLSFGVVLANESPSPQGVQESRLALVIGNGTYKESPLINPPNDSRAISATLKKLGFKVITVENGTFNQMQDALRDFGDQLKLNGGVGLFYYAGHGIQYKNNNYLLPVDAEILREDEVPFVAFDVTRVLQKIEVAGNRLNIVILDACRNNPYARSFRSASKGLAQMDAPTGTIVAFSTAPGSVASDGSGSNGLYTQHLLANMVEPNLKIEEVFKKVRVAVKKTTQGQQVPWENTSLEGDFYFNTRSEKIKPSIEIQKVAMAAPSSNVLKNESSRSVFAGDKWRYQYKSKTNDKKGFAQYEVLDFKDNQVSEVVKINLFNEAPFEMMRELKPDNGLIAFLTQNGRTFSEFAPYSSIFKTLNEATNWNKLTKVAPIGTYLGSSVWTFSYENMGKDTITLPAGKFDAIKVKISGARPMSSNNCHWDDTGSFTHYVWFAPEVKRYIKQELTTYLCTIDSRGAVRSEETFELADYTQN